MNLVDQLLNSNYLNVFNFIKLILLNVYYMLGIVLDFGDRETIKVDMDFVFREFKVLFSKYLLYVQFYILNQREFKENYLFF